MAESAVQNGFFCALMQLNSWPCALTAIKESPTWLKAERAVHNSCAAWDITMTRSSCQNP